MRSVSTSSAVSSTALPAGYIKAPGHGRLDDRRESASADAGYAVLEKKVGDLLMTHNYTQVFKVLGGSRQQCLMSVNLDNVTSHVLV